MPDNLQETRGLGESGAPGNAEVGRKLYRAEPAKPIGDLPRSSERLPDDSGGGAAAEILQMLVARSVEFSKSGFFFILLGCGFLYFAYHVLYHVHPTFVFILALLGLSIVLFGTGTQSLGSGEFSDAGSQAKAKFYLAGGAGVLAGIFGFGAVIGSEKIERVFSNSSGYALVVFEINNPAGSKLQQASVTMHLLDGRQLPLLIRDKSIEVLVPVSRGEGKLAICIEARGADQKWSIDNDCRTLDLRDNEPGQRPEPVQSVGLAKLDISYVNTIGLEEGGKSRTPSNFVAN